MNSGVVCAAVGDELHCLRVDDTGRVCHRVRFANGNWTKWGRLAQDGFESVSACGVVGVLHVVAVNGAGIVFHAIRNEDGSWSGFNQMPDQPLTDPFEDLSG